MTVIVDTSAWYAFVVATDYSHQAAIDFVKQDNDLIFPFTVFEEFEALIQSRFGKKRAIENGGKINKYGVLAPTKADLGASWKIFIDSAADISFVDATVAAVAKRLNLPVFGFDPHFEKLGVKQVPQQKSFPGTVAQFGV